MSKIYKVVITSVDPDTNEEVVEDESELKSVILLGDLAKDDSKFTELVMNASIFDIASKLATGTTMKKAAMLANCLLEIKKDKISGLEDALMKAMMGEVN